MKNYIINSILVLYAFLLSATMAIAQENTIPDSKKAIVELKNGSKVEGEILDWKIGESITLRFDWGGESRIDQYRIKKITQLSAGNRLKAAYLFKDKGYYYSLRLNVIAGNDGSRANGVMGMGVSASAGYRFNHLFSLGGGVAYDRFIWDSGENLVPIFVEATGYLSQQNRSLFYNVQSGYAFAFEDDQYLLSDAKGGFMIYPNIGLRWGTEDVKYILSVGYKFQHAEFTYDSPWNPGERSEQDLLFKRLTIGFGITI